MTVEQLEALRLLDSPTVSNAIEHFGVRPRVEGYAGWELRCAFPELGTMIGYAVTCTADSTTASRRDERGLMKLWEAVEAAPKPAVIACVKVLACAVMGKRIRSRNTRRKASSSSAR